MSIPLFIMYAYTISVSCFLSVEDIRYRAVSSDLLNASMLIVLVLRICWLIENPEFHRIIGGFGSTVVLGSSFTLFNRLRPLRMGIGDVKYIVILSLALGSVVSCLSILVGSIFAVLYMLSEYLKNRWVHDIPFIPYLFAGGIAGSILNFQLTIFRVDNLL